MSNEIRQYDIGVQFILTITEDSSALDISLATTKEIIIQTPSGTSTTYTATFLTDGTDGKIYYTSVDGDLDNIGQHKIQAKVVLSGGTYKSTIEKFKVKANL